MSVLRMTAFGMLGLDFYIVADTIYTDTHIAPGRALLVMGLGALAAVCFMLTLLEEPK